MIMRIPGGKQAMKLKNTKTLPLVIAIVVTIFVTLSAESAERASKVAFTGGTVITVSGPTIEGGVVLVENGIITAVGDGATAIPYDAMEVDCTGMTLAPGFVDPHSADGLDVPNENLPSAPFVDVYDAIDPSRFFFEDSLRNGVTTIHVMQGNNCVVGGVSRVVHPIGLSPDEMTKMSGVALKMSTTPRTGYERQRQLAELREVFNELDRWREDLAETKYEMHAEKEDDADPLPPEEARSKGMELIEDEDLDDAHRHLSYLEDGRLGAWIYCGAATDVAPALALIEERQWQGRAVLVMGGDAHLAVAEIAEAELPVVLGSELIFRKRDAITGDVKETFIPAVYLNAGVKFAMQPARSNAMPERFLGYQAARLVRAGLDPEKALHNITLGAAEVCGIAKQYGSIEAGKIANLVMWTGNPLDFNSWVQKVYVEGILAYDREKDARLEKLFPEPEEEPAPPTPLGDGEDAAEEGADPEGQDSEAGESAPDAGDEADGSGEPIQENSEEKSQKKDQSEEDPPAKEPDGRSTDQPAGGGR